MWRYFLMLVAIVVAVFGITTGVAYLRPVQSITPEPMRVEWAGSIDDEFVTKMRQQLAATKMLVFKRIDVELTSPGGSVIHALRAVHTMLDARKDGVEIRIHGHSLIASAGVWVLGAGTQGQRTIDKRTLTIVHGMQVGGGLFSPPECVDEVSVKDRGHEEQVIIAALLDMIAELQAELAGKSVETARKWGLCGQERAGNGTLLVELGFADRVS